MKDIVLDFDYSCFDDAVSFGGGGGGGSCSVGNLGYNMGVGASAGLATGAVACVATTAGYGACVAASTAVGAAGGAFQSAVECAVSIDSQKVR